MIDVVFKDHLDYARRLLNILGTYRKAEGDGANDEEVI
jgi:hypothetical protein